MTREADPGALKDLLRLVEPSVSRVPKMYVPEPQKYVHCWPRPTKKSSRNATILQTVLGLGLKD